MERLASQDQLQKTQASLTRWDQIRQELGINKSLSLCRQGRMFVAKSNQTQFEHLYLTQNALKGVWQKSTPPQIGQLMCRGGCSCSTRSSAFPATCWGTYTLHPTPYTPRPTPHTPHPAPCTLHPTPFTLHPSPYTLHPSRFTLRVPLLFLRPPGVPPPPLSHHVVSRTPIFGLRVPTCSFFRRETFMHVPPLSEHRQF